VWSREHTLATLNADASQHPLVLAEAVGLPADIAATQRAEVAEVRSCTSAPKGSWEQEPEGIRLEA
jgi:hypothetical protein